MPAARDANANAMRLAALETRVQQLTDRIATLERRTSADDRLWLRALVAVVGGASFTVADLLAMRPHHPRVRALLRGWKVEYRLRDLRDRPLGGLVLRLIKRSHGVRLWRVAMIEDG